MKTVGWQDVFPTGVPGASYNVLVQTCSPKITSYKIDNFCSQGYISPAIKVTIVVETVLPKVTIDSADSIVEAGASTRPICAGFLKKYVQVGL